MLFLGCISVTITGSPSSGVNSARPFTSTRLDALFDVKLTLAPSSALRERERVIRVLCEFYIVDSGAGYRNGERAVRIGEDERRGYNDKPPEFILNNVDSNGLSPSAFTVTVAERSSEPVYARTLKLTVEPMTAVRHHDSLDSAVTSRPPASTIALARPPL